MKTSPQQIALPQRQVAESLQKMLADTYCLYLKTQCFHWNVVGPNFHSLHLLFEGQYQGLASAIDTIAERTRALQAQVPASFSLFLKATTLKEVQTIPSTQGMLQQLVEDHTTVAKLANDCLKLAQKAGDEASADLLIERIQEHDKAAWMLRSCLAS